MTIENTTLVSPESAASAAPVGSESGTAAPSGGAAPGTPPSGELPDLPPTKEDENPFDMNFDEESEFDELETPAAKPVKAAAPPETPPKTPEPAGTPAAAKPVEPPPPAAKPQTPTDAGQSPSPAPTPGDQPTETVKKSFSEVLAEVADKAVPELAKMYTIPPEQAKHFSAEQLPALQTLAGMMHLNALRATASMVESMLPRYVETHMTQSSVKREAEEAFFKAWPTLTREHVPVIQKWGKLWAAGNPNGSLQDYIKAVGSMVTHELGLLGQTAQPAPTGGQPPKPAAPTTRVVPFTPVSGGGAAPQNKPAPTGFDWGTLSENLGRFED